MDRSEGAGSVVVCGNIVQDVLVRPVAAALQWEASSIVESITQQLGGNAGTTSYTLGKLGIPVTLLTLVGRDAAAEAVLSRVRSVGVDTSLAGYTGAPTSAAICLVGEDGRRAILYQLGASAESFETPLHLPENAVHFHLAAVYRMRDLRLRGPEFLCTAKAAGLSTSVDTQWDHEGEWMTVLRPSLPYTDLLFVNEDEGRALTGKQQAREIAHALKDAGAKNVVVKLGSRGCFALADGQEFTAPAAKVNVVDTTGAGDCFAGAYLAALRCGRSHRQSAEFANHVASLAVQALGATEGLANLSAIGTDLLL